MQRRTFLQFAPVAATSAFAATSGSNAAPFKQAWLAEHQGRAMVAAARPDAILIAFAEGMKTLAEIPTPGKIMVGRNRGPRIVSAGKMLVVTAVVNDQPPVYKQHHAAAMGSAHLQRAASIKRVHAEPTGNLICWTSADNGSTWSKPRVVNDVAGAAREGLHGMAAQGQHVVAAWLDLRGKGTKLYAAQSMNGGATWSANALVYESPSGTICQCCHPTVAMSANGEIAVMFRNALDGHRDMYLTRSADGKTFSAATKLGTGTWPLDICPMDGGGLQLDGQGRATAIWQRAKKVYLSTPQQPEVEIADGLHPILAGPVLAWESGKTIYVKRGAQAPQALADGSYPRLLTVGGKTYCAFDTADGFSVKMV